MSYPSDLRSVRSTLLRRGRIPGLRTAKATLAAVLSYVAADLVHTTDQPVLAPLTALLVVQLTLYSTLRHGADRVLSVVAGVLVAVGVASVTGLTWWSLGAVIGLSLVVGRLLRLGPFLLEAPISAMLVLAAAGLGPATPPSDVGAHLAATGRVVETLIGALIGVVVNRVVAPPLYLQPATDAVDELTARISAFSRELATALRAGWTRADAARFLEGARRLGTEVARADRHLDRTEESARLNPGAAPPARPSPGCGHADRARALLPVAAQPLSGGAGPDLHRDRGRNRRRRSRRSRLVRRDRLDRRHRGGLRAGGQGGAGRGARRVRGHRGDPARTAPP